MGISSLLIAFCAGVLGIVSPCVWPLIPIIMASSADSWRSKLAIAFGLAIAFALAGGVFSWLLIAARLDPVIYRDITALLLVFVGIVLISKKLSEKANTILSNLISRTEGQPNYLEHWLGPFGVGLMLGFVWLPCVGPTLGAAIALASRGQDLLLASLIMASYGLGTALSLLAASTGLHHLFRTRTPRWFNFLMQRGKLILGVLLCSLGLLVLSDLDIKFEALVLPYLPTWSQF